MSELPPKILLIACAFTAAEPVVHAFTAAEPTVHASTAGELIAHVC